jgi:hypothetical protein
VAAAPATGTRVSRVAYSGASRGSAPVQ